MFVLIRWICLFYGLSRCQIWPSKGSMSRYTNTTVFTVKLKGTAQRIPSIIPKRVQNVINSLSNERVCMKFGWFFAEILNSEYQEMSLWSPYWNLRCFQSEKQKEISIGKCKVSLDLKVGIFNSQNRCKVVVPNEVGRELEHFNWALFRRFITDSHTNPLQSLYLKTETDKTCK